MKNLTIQAIVKVCQGTYFGDIKVLDKEVKGVVIDSRAVEQDFLYLPVKGERVDGHRFIPDVFAQKALAVLSEVTLEDPKGPYILVNSTLVALKQIAAYYRRQLTIPIIGITGSVGKTSTKEMIASVLKEKYKVHKTLGNLNNEIGLPLTVLQIREEHQVAVLEMGISDFGEMDRLGEIAKPDIGVITNIGYCHLEHLVDRAGVCKAKTEMFAHFNGKGLAILNKDDDQLAQIKSDQNKETCFYGLTEGTAYATNIEPLGFEGMKFVLHLKEQSHLVMLPIPGEHNIYNALAAACVGSSLSMTIEEIARGIEKIKTLAGRNHVIKGNQITVVDDCYNANPVSMQSSIDVLASSKGRTIAVLGDMGELGEGEQELHYEVGAYLAKKEISVLFCTGELSKEIVKGVEKQQNKTKVHYFSQKEELIQALLMEIKPHDTILVKASHFMGYDQIVEAIKKGRLE